MNKQDKKKYSLLMNRIAIAMMLNQGVMALLGWILAMMSPAMAKLLGEGYGFDIAYGSCECLVYFLSFALPMNIFIKMNKDTDREIYEPIESAKMPPYATACAILFSLGAIVLASYLNYYAVNILWDYSDFTSSNLWSVELNSPHQMVIYFVYSAIIPAVAEEYFFRGAICKSLTVYGKGTAIAVSAVLFALMHANVEQLIYAFVAGALLAWIYVETKSIVFPILVHFLNNAIPALGDILKAIYGQDVYNTYVTVTDLSLILLSAISVVGIVIYVKKKGRLIDKLVIKPDENGNFVAPLTLQERASGFFSGGIIVFVVYSLIVMTGLVILSVVA